MVKDFIKGFGGGGKGGGGGSSRQAVEDPDSLRSRQYARVLDAICEGEIEGLVSPDGTVLTSPNLGKGIYINDTPLQDSVSGGFNFQSVTVNATTGMQAQNHIPGFPDIEQEITVGYPVEITNSVPHVQQITDATLSRIRVTLGFPRLTKQDLSNGDTHGTSVAIRILIQTYVLGVPGGWSVYLTDTITGKTTTRYQRAYNITLPKQVANVTGWDIQVVRDTASVVDSSLWNQTFWDSYTKITDYKLTYPNTALVGVSIDASQFNQIPNRSYDVKMLKIKVPTNYFPATRRYTRNVSTGTDMYPTEQTWDGNFYTAWSDNPAWCFYDIVTNTRYGLGEFIIPTQIDIYSLYTIARYCDVLVPNGFGTGSEPRFTCNIYLQEQAEAYKVINDMASIFRAMVYWAGGAIYASQDSPADPKALFSAANVIDGLFHYEGTSRRNRHTVALVGWNDPSDKFLQKIEYVEDTDGIARYGVVKTEVIALGCTSRGQAHRLGQWILYSDKMETETVTFDISLMDIRKVYPGAVIKVSDSSRSGHRWGGRILSATSTSITVDAPASLTSGTYTLSVVLPDGSVETKNVTNTVPSTDVSTFTVDVAFSDTPLVGAMWVLDQTTPTAKTYRILSLTESTKTTIKVAAVAHEPTKFALIESGIKLQTVPLSTVSLTQEAVLSVAVTSEAVTQLDGSIMAKLTASWPAALLIKNQAARYTAEYKCDSDNWVEMGGVKGLIAEASITKAGTYTVRVTAYNSLGLASTPTYSSPTAINWNVLGGVSNLALTSAFTGIDPDIKWDALPGAASYTITVSSGGVLKRTVTKFTDNHYTYRLSDAQSDGGPFRALDFTVRAVDFAGTAGITSGLSVSNQQIGAPAGVLATQGVGSVTVSATKPTETDYAGTMIYMSTTTGFTPGAGNLVYDGPNNYFTNIGLGGAIPVYYRIGHYDTFGKDSMTLSTEASVTPFAAAGGGLAIVATLPVTGMTEGDCVYLTTDDKIYRFVVNGTYPAGAWSTYIDGSDILANTVTAGKMSVVSLSTITANMGSINSGNITVDASGFIKTTGMTDYNTGTGIWMGYNAGAYKMSVGSSTSGFMWDGNAFNIYGGSININNLFTVSAAGAVNIKSATSGARLEIYNNVIKVFDSAGVLRVKLGDLSA